MKYFITQSQRHFIICLPIVLLAASGCASRGDYSYDSPAALVQPTRMYWLNAYGDDSGSMEAAENCRKQLRANPNYVSLLKEGAAIAVRPSIDRTPADKRRAIEIRGLRGKMMNTCMLSKGFRHDPKGVPIKRP